MRPTLNRTMCALHIIFMIHLQIMPKSSGPIRKTARNGGLQSLL